MPKYLVIQLARFGDLIQTKRLIGSLEAEGAQVHLCLDHSLAALARMVYPNCQLHPIVAHASGLGGTSATLRILTENRLVFSALQRESFDAVFNLNFSGLNFRISVLFDPETVSGYSMRNGQERIGKWPELAMRWSRDRRVGLNLVDFWGCYAPVPMAPAAVNPDAVPGGRGLGVVLAGRESRRSLPMDVLARIVATRFGRTKGNIYLFGSTTEVPAARQLVKLLPRNVSEHVRDLSGKTDWKGLVESLQGLDALITPDTGTMHLAAHLGVPVEAFFLSSAWCFETGPYGKEHTVYQAVTDCLPCLESRPCPYDVKCRQPMDSDAMLRYLTTRKPEHCPGGLLVYASDFDEMGLNFRALFGADNDAERRENFRAFLAPHAHARPQTFEGHNASSFAAAYYIERDWFV